MKKYINEQVFSLRYTDKEKERIKNRLKAEQVDRVILFVPRSYENDAHRQECIEALIDNKDYFERQGFEVAVNINTLGFGDTIEPMITNADGKAGRIQGTFTQIHDLYGRHTGEAYCPTDKNFVKNICDYLADIVRTGIRMVILEDCLCLNVRPGIGCACDAHLQLMKEELGEEISRKALREKLFCGGPNKYRKAWLKVNGDTLRNFCKELRKTVDEIDSTVRMGQMVSYTNWDLEGADAIELSKILAGNTRPIMRLSGAPYWVSSFQRFSHLGMSLQTVIESIRLQETWCAQEDIELLDENDNFPRPRTHCPASFNECYDLCLTASGNTEAFLHNGIAMRDTSEESRYDTGYVEEFVRNNVVRVFLKDNFTGKTVGVHVFEPMHKVCHTTFPEEFIGQQSIMDQAFSIAQTFLANLSFPTSMEGEDSAIAAFGVSAKLLDELSRERNLLLDAEGARELIASGVDTGIYRMTKTSCPDKEFFPADNETITLYYTAGNYYKMELQENAHVLSWFIIHDELVPAVIRYENEQGQRFVVMAFDCYSMRHDSDILTSYFRQKQMYEALSYLGCRIPAFSAGNPGLYFICREDTEKLSVAVCNLSADWIREPVILLDQAYKEITICNTAANLIGKKMKLKSDIAPYGFTCFVLWKNDLKR